MTTDNDYYFLILYPFQERILKIINDLNTGFYLTGGTASSRGYLHHRFSDDIDLFVNDDPQFTLWTERIIHAISKRTAIKIDVMQKEERFVRLFLIEKAVGLKVELINDVPSHIGEIRSHETLGMIDSPENILANKVTASIGRKEPKDLADIWGFCCKMGLSLNTAITNADSKAAGIFSPDVARVLCSANRSDWEVIRWIAKPDCKLFLNDMEKLGESILNL